MYITDLGILIKKVVVFSVILFSCLLAFQAISTNRVSAAYEGGHLIDNGLYLDAASMNAAQIQSFLTGKGGALANKSFVMNCDAAGQQAKQIYLSLGAPCDQSVLASQIIYYAAQVYGISPRAILVTLQKEQSLVTATNPTDRQYAQAMGYACPTSGNCDASSNFFWQIDNATWVLRFHYERARGNMNWWYTSTSWTCGTQKAYYRPNLYPNQNVNFYDEDNVYYRTHFIVTAATSALYCYTPHAYNNPQGLYGLPTYGTTGRYYTGSYNFVKFYELWFGSTRNGEHFWRVLRTQDDGRLFLQVGNTKRWIPTGEIYADWTLDDYPIDIVGQSEFDSIPTIPELTRLGTDGQYSYIVENGRRHYLPGNYVALWNYQGVIAAPVRSLLLTIPEHEPMGRIIKDAGGSYWIINGSTRHSISNADLGAWGYTPNNVVGIGNAYLSQIPTGPAVSRHINYSGVNYVVDQGNLIKMTDSVLAATWGSSSYVTINPFAPSILPIRANASFLVRAQDSPHWFVLIDGKKYYVPNGNIAANWGIAGSSILSIDPLLLSQFASGGNLTNFAKDTTTQKVYILDGKRHHIPTNNLLTTLIASPSEIIDVTSARVTQIVESTPYTKPLVMIANTPHLFLLDKGKRYHISTGALSGSFNAWGSYMQLSNTFVDTIPLAPVALKSVFKDSSDAYYLADGGKKYRIDEDVKSSWIATDNPLFSDEITELIPSGLSTIETSYVKFSNNTYLLDRGRKIRITPGLVSTYAGSSNAFQLANDTITQNPSDASYLVRSRNNQKVWFINQGTRAEVDFTEQVSLGYLSRGVPIIDLDDSFLSTFPTSNNMSLLIRKQGSWGIKLINFGHSLGFPDGTTLNNFIDIANPILVVDDWTYDQFPLLGSSSRIIKDDSGKLYLMENGRRRWITNWTAYLPYSNIPITYLYGTTMMLIPEGSVIN